MQKRFGGNAIAVDDQNEPKLPKFWCLGEIQTNGKETPSCIQQYILRKMEHLGNPKMKTCFKYSKIF